MSDTLRQLISFKSSILARCLKCVSGSKATDLWKPSSVMPSCGCNECQFDKKMATRWSLELKSSEFHKPLARHASDVTSAHDKRHHLPPIKQERSKKALPDTYRLFFQIIPASALASDEESSDFRARLGMDAKPSATCFHCISSYLCICHTAPSFIASRSQQTAHHLAIRFNDADTISEDKTGYIASIASKLRVRGVASDSRTTLSHCKVTSQSSAWSAHHPYRSLRARRTKTRRPQHFLLHSHP